MSTALQVRADMVRALEVDLIGPYADDEKLVDRAPSRFYMTGFLVPREGRADVWRSNDSWVGSARASGAELAAKLIERIRNDTDDQDLAGWDPSLR